MKFRFLVFVLLLSFQGLANTPTEESVPYFVGDGELFDFAIDTTANKATLFLSDKNDNSPLSGAKVSLQPEGSDKSLEFSETSSPGVYEAKVSDNALLRGFVIVEMKNNNDAIETKIPSYKEIKKNEVPSTHQSKLEFKDLIIGFALGAVFIAVLILLVFFFRRRKAASALLILFAIPFANKSDFAFAHDGGHGEEPKKEEQEGRTQEVVLSKKSQFLLELKTKVIKKEPVSPVVKSFGHVIPRPQDDAVIVAPQPGFAVGFKDISLGRKVKKGEELGFIQSVSQIPLRSPIDGEIAEIHVAEGSRIESGSKIFRIINRNILWIDAELFANELSQVKNAKKSFVTIDGFAQTLEAKILGAMTPISEETRTAKFFVEILESPKAIDVGSFVCIDFILDGSSEALTIPSSAVLRKSGENIVFVKTSPETFEWRKVLVKESSIPGTVIITGDISEGDRIVTSGNYQLSMKVR